MKQRLIKQANPLLQQYRRFKSFLTTGWRRKLLPVFFITFSVIVITRVITGNWDTLTDYEWQVQPSWLLFAVIVFIVDFSFSVWIWYLLVVRLTQYNNFYRTTKIYLYANFSRRIPGMVWYIASRAVLYQEVGISKTQTSLLSALELALFTISGFVVTLLTLPFWTGPSTVLSPAIQLWALIIMIPLSILLVHPTTLNTLWKKINQTSPPPNLRWQSTITWLFFYVITWILGGIVLWAVINFLHPLPSSNFISVIGMWSLSGTISLVGFLTISVFGLREITLTLLLAQLLPLPVTIIIAIIVRLLWLSGEFLASLVSLKM